MTQTMNSPLPHLAFCALVALSIEKQTTGASGRFAENLFLLRWLTVAQKQKRFPKSLAGDIIRLINAARTPGANVSLKDKFEVIWRTGSEEVHPHSDLYRLNAAITALREQGWNNFLLSQDEWAKLTGRNATDERDTVYMTKAALEAGFDERGQQIGQVEMRVIGNVDVLQLVLNTYALSTTCGMDHTAYRPVFLNTPSLTVA